jgi:Carboxypeptidase regulatory-like domain
LNVTQQRQRTVIACLLLAGLVCLLAGHAIGQTTTGSIYGTVTDQTGSIVVNATVTVTSVQTGAVQTAQSNGSGNFIFPALAPGDYTITSRSQGFNVETQTGLHLDANQNLNASFSLKAGSENQSVTVTAATTLVDTRESQLSETVDQRRIQDLPLNGRDPYFLVQIVPGITAYTAQSPVGDSHGTTFSVNGNRAVANTVYLDGAFDTSVYTSGGNLLPNPDALQEFRLLTSNFDAEYGRYPGAVVNAITRSGTNQFHGGVHEYLRNNVLNAKNYFNTSVTPLKQNQFGGNFGGPIKRDKAFFFVSYEGLRIVTPAILSGTALPTLTAAESMGDFSAANPKLWPKMANGAPYSCNGVQGVICPNLLDPVAQALMKYVPLENPATGTTVEQVAPANTSGNQGLARIDYQLKNHLVSGTFFQSRGTNLNPLKGSGVGNQILNYSGLASASTITNVALSDTWTISTNKLNVFRPFYTLNHFNGTNIFNGPTWGDLGSTIQVGAYPLTQPEITITGYWNMGMGSGGPDNIHQQAFGVEDTFNWTKGDHTIKFGGSFIWNKYDEHGMYLGTGQATFNGHTTGNAAADFLLGSASAFRQNNGANHGLHAPYPSLFAQDDWRITNRLTIDLGLRWEVYAPFVGQDNLGTFVPYVQSIRFPTAPLGLLSVGDPGIVDGITHTQYNDFAPRIGFAYDVFGTGKTSVRGGYGIFYASRAVSQITNPEQQPFILDNTISISNLVAPYAPNPDPFPYVLNLKDPVFHSGATITGLPPGAGFPYVYEYNFMVEQQLSSSWGARIAYVGSLTRKNYISRDENEPAYIPGASTSTAGLNARRPYQPTPSTYVFGQIVENDPAGSGSYNSLQATLTHRFSHGVSLLASYVFAKSLDISSIEPANITLTLSNQNNVAADYGRSDFNAPQRFVASYIWATPPVGRWGIIGKQVLGNWQLNGITTIGSGQPFTVTSGVDSNLDGINTDRPNLIGKPELSGLGRRAKISRQFNTSAFAQVPAGVPYGTAGRNILTAPAYVNTDFSAFKNFPIREWGTLQFRAEGFNVFNNVNLAAPNGVMTSPNFGQISGLVAGSQPRLVQFALRYSF